MDGESFRWVLFIGDERADVEESGAVFCDADGPIAEAYASYRSDFAGAGEGKAECFRNALDDGVGDALGGDCFRGRGGGGDVGGGGEEQGGGLLRFIRD